MPTPFGLDLVKLEGVTAPMPYMRPEVAEKYNQLRNEVCVKSGVDFLARCGDIFRTASFTSKKDGVATRSWHKCGMAFDYDQDNKSLVIVSEPRNGKQYFRTYLKCANQDGTQGAKKTVKDYRGHSVSAYLFDFTATAERIGFRRIPAWNGWQRNYNRREFWHMQMDFGLTWDAAMAQLKSGASTPAKPASVNKVWGLNDRGIGVRKIQSRLNELGFLAAKEIDGVFGAKTKTAVQKFQKRKGIAADGLVGPKTIALF